MKCPKCAYLGFDEVERCRNCGYDFSLSTPSARPTPDLALRSDSPSLDPLGDLSLVDAAMSTAPAVGTGDSGPDLDRLFGVPTPPSATLNAAGRSEELPLFGPPITDDEPLITKPSPPRQPLAVRRATPEPAKSRVEQPSRSATVDLAVEPDRSGAPSAPRRAARSPWSSRTSESPEAAGTETVAAAPDAGIFARLVAVVIDVVILALIDAAVIYFTMQICNVTLDEVAILPKGPLLAFLLVQNGGYLVTFTAGGQTLGKMAAGVRVVPAGSDGPLDLGRAFLRTMMWGLLAVPAGLGFLPALFARDRRGLHDRFAGTRVVRASA
jgi:uncharacterized RDD family membrane protein YckC